MVFAVHTMPYNEYTVPVLIILETKSPRNECTVRVFYCKHRFVLRVHRTRVYITVNRMSYNEYTVYASKMSYTKYKMQAHRMPYEYTLTRSFHWISRAAATKINLRRLFSSGRPSKFIRYKSQCHRFPTNFPQIKRKYQHARTPTNTMRWYPYLGSCISRKQRIYVRMYVRTYVCHYR
jgi:hypothetical protein